MVRPLSKRRSFVAMLIASLEEVTKSVTTDMVDGRPSSAALALVPPDSNVRGASRVSPRALAVRRAWGVGGVGRKQQRRLPGKNVANKGCVGPPPSPPLMTSFMTSSSPRAPAPPRGGGG
mgnify:CR=1 FL=1